MISPESQLIPSYHLQRGDQTHGPYSMEDLRSYVLYGTVKPADAVWDEVHQSWMRIQDLLGPAAQPSEPAELEDGGWLNPVKKALTWLTLTPRQRAASAPRRIVRYRDYQKVPLPQRAGRVLIKLVIGALIFPPWLWASCSTLFSQRIFRNKADDHGYLQLLSSKFEILAAVLLVLNTLAIGAGLWFFTTAVWPEITAVAHSAITAAQDLIAEIKGN